MNTCRNVLLYDEFQKICNKLSINSDNTILHLVSTIDISQPSIIGRHISYRDNRKEHDIYVSTKLNDTNMKRTMVHELAHYLYDINCIDNNKFILNELKKAFRHTKHTIPYSRTNIHEFFACSFEEYYCNPTTYIQLNPYMYNLFKNILKFRSGENTKVFTINDEYNHIYLGLRKYDDMFLLSSTEYNRYLFFFKKKITTYETLLQYNRRMINRFQALDK